MSERDEQQLARRLATLTPQREALATP